MSLDPTLTFATWRKILRSDALIAGLQSPESRDAALNRLSPEEREIFLDYAKAPLAADMYVDIFRSNLRMNLHSALKLTPRSRRVLFGGGADGHRAVSEFSKKTDYRDYGAKFWTLLDAFLRDLSESGLLMRQEHRDIVQLELAHVQLMRSMGGTAPRARPGRESQRVTDRSVLRPGDNARTVRVQFDLTDWLASPQAFDPNETPAAGDAYWLVYVEGAELPPAFAELSERAFHIATRIQSGSASLTELIGDYPHVGKEDLVELLESLLELGAIRAGE